MLAILTNELWNICVRFWATAKEEKISKIKKGSPIEMTL